MTTRPTATRLDRSQRGFTLPEVLVALALLAVAMVGVIPMIMLSARGSTFNRNRVNASNDARRRLESLRLLPFDSLGLGIASTTPPYLGFYEANPITHPLYTANEDTYLKSTSEISPGVFGLRTVLIQAVDDPADGTGAGDKDGITTDYKRVTAIVEWKEKNQTRSVRQITYMYGANANIAVQGEPLGQGPMGKGIKATVAIGVPDTE